jgi:1,4-alpha-glucan branching enzyme
MHDALEYLQNDPIHRRYHHNRITFRSLYAFNENFVLPLSHDEVVHGKGSLINKMPGDDWRQRANLRLLYGNLYAQPGKKLLFMGAELGQYKEWNHDSSLDWDLLDDPGHAGIARWLEDLNRLYREDPALHEGDCNPDGYEWIDGSDAEHSVVAFLRRSTETQAEPVAVIFNFTPVPRENYRIGVPGSGYWRELLNSDAPEYGGSGKGNLGGVEAAPIPMHGKSHSLTLSLPPLGVLFLKRDAPPEEPVDESEEVEEELGETEEGEAAGLDEDEDLEDIPAE